MHKDFLRDLAFFLVGLGVDLREVLEDPQAFRDNPKFSIWLESAKRLGVIEEDSGTLRVNREALLGIKEKLKEVLESWISE